MIKQSFLVILILFVACTPTGTETVTLTDSPSTKVPTEIPTTDIPTPEPATSIPIPEITPFAVSQEMIFAGLSVQFTSPDSMTCDLYVLSDFPNILSTDPALCLPDTPFNNILWGKLINAEDEILTLIKYFDTLDFLHDYLQAEVYASNNSGFGIDPQDSVEQQYVLFELNLNGNVHIVILWLNTLEAQAEINEANEGDDETNEDTWAPPPQPTEWPD